MTIEDISVKSMRILAAFAVSLALVGCVGGEGDALPPSDDLQSIAVSNVEVVEGRISTAVAQGTFSGGSIADISDLVQWSTAVPNVATVSNSAGSKGRVTGVRQGTTGITASLNGVDGSGVVTVLEAAVESLSATPSSLSIEVGQTRVIDAQATFSDGESRLVTGSADYTVNDSSIAGVSTADGERGQVTGAGVGSTSVTIAFGGQSVSVPVEVTPALESIAVTGAGGVPLGRSASYVATGTFSGGGTEDLTSQVAWTTSDTGVATINSSGALTTVAQGSAQVVATLRGVEGLLAVDVVDPVFETVAIDGLASGLPVGRTAPLTALATLSDGSRQDVTQTATWGSSEPGRATVTTSGVRGVVEGVSQGAATITASVSDAEGTKAGTASVQIVAAVIEGVSVTPAVVELPEGISRALSLSATFSDGSVQTVTSEAEWSTSEAGVVTVNNTDNKGLIQGVTAGTASITGLFDGETATAAIEVVPAVLESITVSPGSFSVPAGRTRQLQASGAFSDGSNRDISDSVTWSSSDDGVVSIDADGLATAVANGTATLTASAQGQTGTATATISEAVLESLSLFCPELTVERGRVIQCTSTGTFSDNTTQDLTSDTTWSSADPAVATIGNGADNGGRLRAVEIGTTGISGSASTGDSVIEAADVAVEVIGPAIESVVLTPANINVPIGRTRELTAEVVFTDDSRADVTEEAGWVSEDNTKASVSNEDGSRGVVTGIELTAGAPVCVNAIFDGVTSNCANVEVSDAVITEINVNPISAGVNLGDTLQFRVSASFSDGEAQQRDATEEVIWTSSDESVATVSNAEGSRGLVTSLAVGTTLITASDPDGVADPDTADFEVLPAEVRAVAIDDGVREVSAGLTIELTATGTLSDGSTEDVTDDATWTSDDESIATVTAGVVRGVATGDVAITVTSGFSSDTVTISVVEPDLVAIRIAPEDRTVELPLNPLDENPTVNYQVVAEFSDGSFENVTTVVDQYTSSDTDVATITANGIAEAQAAGETTISAAYEGLTVSTTLTVEPAVGGGGPLGF